MTKDHRNTIIGSSESRALLWNLLLGNQIESAASVGTGERRLGPKSGKEMAGYMQKCVHGIIKKLLVALVKDSSCLIELCPVVLQ